MPSRQYCLVVESAPFGLITNTSQEEGLLAGVFIQDLKSWRSLSTSLTTMFNNTTSSPIKTPLTIDEIVNSIERYFIHKTGIRPKDWVKSYIQKVLIEASNDPLVFVENLCHDVMEKILAQIDFMTKHPLLIFLHEDGLFLALCHSDTVKEILLKHREVYSVNQIENFLLDRNVPKQVSISGIRFGSLSRMSDVKNIGIRVDILEDSSTNVQYYKFDTKQLSYELGLYIIKIELCKAVIFDKILNNLNTNVEEDDLPNITILVERYGSEKLKQICPHEKEYASIWQSFHNKENDRPKHLNLLSTNSTITTAAAANSNNIGYNTWNSNMDTIDPTSLPDCQESSSHLNYPELGMPFVSETQTPETLSNTPQYFAAPLILQTPPPIVIVITNPNHHTMSDEDISLLVSNRLPAYSHLLQSSLIHRLNID